MSESLVVISIQNFKEFTTLATERDLCNSEKLDKSPANSELSPEEGSVVSQGSIVKATMFREFIYMKILDETHEKLHDGINTEQSNDF